jgi:hypothetical protein
MLTPDQRVSIQNGTLLFLFSLRLMKTELFLKEMMSSPKYQAEGSNIGSVYPEMTNLPDIGVARKN